MKVIAAKKWFRLSLLNLAIVALYGTLMRYKIAFDFPFFEQKHLLHAHSHFAFSGWLSHLLYTCFAVLISNYLPEQKQKKYNKLIILNLICSFGMLAAFTIQGYKAVSILFSTLSIIVAACYAVYFIKDTKHLPQKHPSKPWAITGLLLNVVSAAGPFFLAYMMASKSIDSNLYLGSVYYYLHFQYNGWFFFGAMAMVAAYMPSIQLNRYFTFFAATIIPTFFLSILWAHLPLWLYSITAIAAIVQLLAWLALLQKLYPALKLITPSPYPNWINTFFITAAIAVTLKFLLQAISAIPSLSQLVFGFRPIVIAYLHLILLGVFSLFFIGYMFSKYWLQPSTTAKLGAFVFWAGVLVNETLLAIQGFSAFAYIPVPYINIMLLTAALLLLTGSSILYFSQLKAKGVTDKYSSI